MSIKNLAATKYQQRLDDLFKKVKLIEDIELQAHWAKYLCILVSGFLESSISAIYSEYAQKCANSNIANYVERQLNGFQNPNMTKILALAGSFNANWRKELEKATESQIKDSIDSVVRIRNSIAHGQNIGVSHSYIKIYYQDAVKVVELIEKQCNP